MIPSIERRKYEPLVDLRSHGAAIVPVQVEELCLPGRKVVVFISIAYRSLRWANIHGANTSTLAMLPHSSSAADMAGGTGRSSDIMASQLSVAG